MPSKTPLLEPAHAELLRELGERLRHARLRRGLSAAALAALAQVSRVTVHRSEAGAPAIAIGTLVKIMAVLKLASDVALLARDDHQGQAMQDARLRPRRGTAAKARPAAAPRSIQLARYPQLRQIAWSLQPETTALSAEEALALYERNWRHIDPAAMSTHEQALVKRLTDTVGKGVLLV